MNVRKMLKSVSKLVPSRISMSIVNVNFIIKDEISRSKYARFTPIKKDIVVIVLNFQSDLFDGTVLICLMQSDHIV